MSLQWTLIATFLYSEIAIISIFLMSIIRPQYWRSFFNSRFIKMISAQSNMYLFAFIAILFLFFVESVREFHKYSNKVAAAQDGHYMGSPSFYEDQMRLFRGQRNFYISGFSLFCLFIIKRLASLISNQAVLMADADASRRQATNAAQFLANAGDEASSSDEDKKKLEEENTVLVAEVEKFKKQVNTLKTDIQALKKQTEATNKEYSRLTDEYAKLQNKLDSVGGSSKDK